MNSAKNTQQTDGHHPTSKTYNLRLKKPNYWNTASPSNEQTLLARWRELDLLSLLKDKRSGADKFWLLDGPPYANGDAHLGHLLNKTLKDVAARHANLVGRDVVWRSGWDCHGLPLELAVEKRHGRDAKADPVAFMDLCRQEAHHWQSVQSNSMQRVGLLADFDKPWMSLDKPREATSLRLLLDLWKAGLLVERNSPVHWCPACQSALAASELEKVEKTRLEAFFLSTLTVQSTFAMTVKSPELSNFLCGDALYVMAWTSTPWTLWANAGFGFPEKGAVTVVRLASGQAVLMAVSARDSLMAEHPELLRMPNKSFDGFVDFADLAALHLEALSPLTNLLSPLLPASFATTSEGTGFVHLAPAFGPEDYEMHDKFGLRIDCHVMSNGRVSDVPGAVPMPAALLGTTLEEASVVSCDLLLSAGLLVKQFSKNVEAQACWRHKKAVFYKASPQWALDLERPFAGCPEGLAARAVSAVHQTRFVPDERAKGPLLHMLATRRFWTLSRDRLWGLPLPFFKNLKTGELHPETESMWQKLVDLVSVSGVEAWHALPTPAGYGRSKQTADVWFDSGSAWLSASENGSTEADFVVEGQDQTRGWFLSSFLLHAFVSPLPPFKSVVTHSFVVDENGHKFSKSKGGTPDHKALFDKAGADAFRLWVCAQNVGDESKWSKTALDQASQELRDWRSFLRFHLSNMPEVAHTAKPEYVRPLDELALVKLAAAKESWGTFMNRGRFNLALNSLSVFRQWASTEWFELSKRTLYCANDMSPDLLSVQWALEQTFVLCAQLLSPFLPFATEESYLAWSGHTESSLFLLTLENWTHPASSATEAALKLLTMRREVLPLVERSRVLVEKGSPVCVVFPADFVDAVGDDAARDLLPGCYVRRGTEQDLVSSERGTFGRYVAVAGKPYDHLAANRCDRCRGFFANKLNEDGLCGLCVKEMTHSA